MSSDNTKRHETFESEHEIDSETLHNFNTLKSNLALEMEFIENTLRSHPLSINTARQFDIDIKYSENTNSSERTDTHVNANDDEHNIIIASYASLAKASSETLSLFMKSFPMEDSFALREAIEYGKILMLLAVMLNDNVYLSNDFAKLVRFVRGKFNMDTRWAEHKTTISDLCNKADMLWADGSNLTHEKMAKMLLKTNEKEDEIAQSTLMLHLLLTARKYGKVRGEKAVKKSPPA